MFRRQTKTQTNISEYGYINIKIDKMEEKRIMDIKNKVRLVQEKEIELLKIFSEICEQHNLTYYALGGTLLGAIRHGGFIPWDDDMDLGMPREDYDKFIEISGSVLPKHVLLKHHTDNLGNTSIRDTSTVITFGTTDCNPFLDIFPLDGFPEKGLSKWTHEKHILFYRMLSKLSVVQEISDRDRGAFENTLVKVARVTKIDKILNTEKINKKLHKVIRKYDFYSSPRGGNILGTYRDKEIVPIEVFGKPKKMEFEGMQLSVHSEPEKYLENIYGDFMRLPKEEDRVGHFEAAYGK